MTAMNGKMKAICANRSIQTLHALMGLTSPEVLKYNYADVTSFIVNDSFDQLHRWQMATFKLPVWQTKTNRKVAKSVHQTRAATVADNFESHKNEVSDCGSGLLCWLQSRKASMAQIAITIIMGPAAVQQYWSSNEPENCRKPVNMLCMGGAGVQM